MYMMIPSMMQHHNISRFAAFELFALRCEAAALGADVIDPLPPLRTAMQ